MNNEIPICFFILAISTPEENVFRMNKQLREHLLLVRLRFPIHKTPATVTVEAKGLILIPLEQAWF